MTFVTVTVTVCVVMFPDASVATTPTTYVLLFATSPASDGDSKSGARMKRSAPVASIENFPTSGPVRLQVTALLAVNVCTAVVFSTIEVALVAAPAPPLGPVMIGAASSVFVTVTVTVWIAKLPAASVARTSTTYVLFAAPAPRSVGASKSGADAKRSAPVAGSIAKAAASAPPLMLQTAASLAAKVCTAVVFSGTDFTLVAAPAEPLGPVMLGAVSSASVTVTVTVWVETLPAASVAVTTTT